MKYFCLKFYFKQNKIFKLCDAYPEKNNIEN